MSKSKGFRVQSSKEGTPSKEAFAQMLIGGIVRRPDGEIDYESAGFHDANHWCTVHRQQIMDWADEAGRPGDMDWAWLERIHDFLPLFRSGEEFDAYFSVVLYIHNEDDKEGVDADEERKEEQVRGEMPC